VVLEGFVVLDAVESIHGGGVLVWYHWNDSCLLG